jgi:hypothetical protein
MTEKKVVQTVINDAENVKKGKTTDTLHHCK